MKTKQPYSLIVPSTIKEIIDDNVLRNREMYYFIIDYIINRQQTSFVNVYGIKKITGSDSKTYIYKLKKLNVLIDDGITKHGSKKLYYKINELYLNEMSFVEIAKDNHFYKKLHKQNSKKNYRQKLKSDHLFKMYQSFCKLKIKEQEALSFIDKNIHEPARNFYYSLAVISFKHKRFNRNKTNNRLDTNLTNLPKCLRRFVFEPDKYVFLDISNSQIVFMLYLIELLATTTTTTQPPFNSSQVKFLNLNKTVGIANVQQIQKILKNGKITENKCFMKFKEMVLSGSFYLYLAPFFKKTEKETKYLTFKILFSAIDNYTNLKQIFKNEFSDILEIMELIKKRKHNNLSNLLSKLEAYAILDVCCKKLVEAGITVYTIHDCFIVPKIHEEQALFIIQDSFKTLFNGVPKFKREDVDK